ncbi:MAG: hypothetical protein AB8B84_11000 [Granulosicoccus sp.]
MSAEGDTDMAANAWPGFVDILSAVVIMFVFFVLIIAAVLYFYTITYKAKVEGRVTSELSRVFVEAEILELKELKRENKELRNELKSKETKISEGGGKSTVAVKNETEAAQSFGEQSTEQIVMASDDDKSMVILHDAGAITVDEESETKIMEFIEQMSQQHGSEKLEVVLTSPKTANAATQSREKRLAVARMLNVRNSLLSSSIDRENINLTVVEAEEIEDSEGWTRLQINVLE